MKRVKSLIYFPVFVARKYLFSRGEPRFASFLTFVAACGVAVGVAALIIVISVMTGFGDDLEAKLRGFNPHITVIAPTSSTSEITKNIMANFPGISEIEPFVTGEIVVQTEGKGGLSAMGAKVFGFRKLPERLKKHTKLRWSEDIFGDLWWQKYFSPLNFGILLGEEMMYQIGSYPEPMSLVQLIAPFGGVDPLGNPSPSRREYRVVGAFKSGFFEYDTKCILMSLDEAGKLLKSQGRYGIQIMLERPGKVQSFVDNLQNFLGPSYEVSGWTSKNKRLFAALKLEKFAMTFLLLLIVVIASFSVVAVTLMIFFSKRRDLAILMAMGSSRRSIERIFLFHGALIGFCGAIFGGGVGVAICMIIKRSNIMLPPSYYLDYLPVSLSWLRVLLITVGGVLISVAASYYPARRASETDPVELLRYE